MEATTSRPTASGPSRRVGRVLFLTALVVVFPIAALVTILATWSYSEYVAKDPAAVCERYNNEWFDRIGDLEASRRSWLPPAVECTFRTSDGRLLISTRPRHPVGDLLWAVAAPAEMVATVIVARRAVRRYVAGRLVEPDLVAA